MSSTEPDNNNFKKHSSEDQNLMPVNDQVSSGRCKAPDYFRGGKTELVYSVQWTRVKRSIIR